MEADANELGGMVGGGVFDRVVGAGVCEGDRSGEAESRPGETCREDASRGGSSRSGERRSSKMEVRSGDRRASLEESAIMWWW